MANDFLKGWTTTIVVTIITLLYIEKFFHLFRDIIFGLIFNKEKNRFLKIETSIAGVMVFIFISIILVFIVLIFQQIISQYL
jgi:hypothetical protein